MSFFGHSSRVALVLAAFAVPLLAWGAFQTLQFSANDPTQWVPVTHPVRRDYEQFTRQFENGDALVVSWPGCKLESESLQRFVTELRREDAFCDLDAKPYFEQVVSGTELLLGLSAGRPDTPPEELVRRLQGVVIGPDGQTTCAVVTFTKAGSRDRKQAIAEIRRTLTDVCDVPAADQHLAGPIVDGHDVDAASAESMNVFAPISTAVILLLCWWSLKSLRLALLVFLVSVFCEVLTLALVHYCGDTLTPLMIVMPPLILVLGVSGGIHLVNYYFDALDHGDAATAPRRAARIGWMPCLLSSGTTAIGLASLLVSDLSPIRDFGLYASIGTLATLAALFLFVPGAFELWPQRRQHAACSDPNVSAPHESSNGVCGRLARLLTRHHAFVTVLSISAMIVTGWAVPRLKTSVRIDTLFPKHSRILQDYSWLEEHVGPLVPIEVLIRFDANSELSFLERLRRVGAIQQELAKLSDVQGTLSAATFAPDVAPLLQDMPPAMRMVALRKFSMKATEQFEQLRLLRRTDDAEVWRVTARVSALADLDYGHFLAVVKRQIEPLLAEPDSTESSPTTATVTGMMPVVHEIQRELFRDLFNSFLSAFAVITLVMMWAEGGVLAGLVSMISNLFPMVLMFGLLGWVQMPLDIGTVMTASVALGMAIDGTLHFLTFYRRGIELGQSRQQAVEAAYRHCAPAMTESSVSCGLGLFMFVFSSFLPTHRFAWMMLALIAAALMGDLVVLPALLAGPLGRLFPSRSKVPLSEWLSDSQTTVSRSAEVMIPDPHVIAAALVVSVPEPIGADTSPPQITGRSLKSWLGE